MHAPLDKLNGARVICYTPLDERHVPTGAGAVLAAKLFTVATMELLLRTPRLAG